MRKHTIVLAGVILSIAFAGTSACAQEQFVVVNIIPGEQFLPVFEQLQDLTKDRRSTRIGIGIGAIFSYLNTSREGCKEDLRNFLGLAERFDIPVVVQLDGEQWWDGRPDLWNWWDHARPGYSPENRMNVEWSGWGPAHALKIAWRNWGSQIRVLPPPNLMSPKYRAACHQEMRALIPVILRWWTRLPAGKKYLLLGVKLGWESSIGVNAFYYPNGNALLERPEAEDPRRDLKAEEVPDRGVEAVGYAAVTTEHLARIGKIREDHLAEIVRRHLVDLCALASKLGVPRDRLFTHVGGWKEEELLYDAALNKYSCPGWSFYRHAGDPARDMGVQRVLHKSNAPYWAAAEWLLMGKHTPEEWNGALQRTLAIPGCRYVCIYNWSGIMKDDAATGAIQAMLGVPTDSVKRAP
jgi:hypothetical protein